MLPASRNSPGSYNNNTVAFFMLLSTLAYQLYNTSPVQTTRAAGQYTCPQLHNQCLATIHHIFAVIFNLKKQHSVLAGEKRYANRHNDKLKKSNPFYFSTTDWLPVMPY